MLRMLRPQQPPSPRPPPKQPTDPAAGSRTRGRGVVLGGPPAALLEELAVRLRVAVVVRHPLGGWRGGRGALWLRAEPKRGRSRIGGGGGGPPPACGVSLIGGTVSKRSWGESAGAHPVALPAGPGPGKLLDEAVEVQLLRPPRGVRPTPPPTDQGLIGRPGMVGPGSREDSPNGLIPNSH